MLLHLKIISLLLKIRFIPGQWHISQSAAPWLKWLKYTQRSKCFRLFFVNFSIYQFILCWRDLTSIHFSKCSGCWGRTRWVKGRSPVPLAQEHHLQTAPEEYIVNSMYFNQYFLLNISHKYLSTGSKERTTRGKRMRSCLNVTGDGEAGDGNDHIEDVLPANEVLHQEAGETTPSSRLRERISAFWKPKINWWPFSHCHHWLWLQNAQQPCSFCYPVFCTISNKHFQIVKVCWEQASYKHCISLSPNLPEKLCPKQMNWEGGPTEEREEKDDQPVPDVRPLSTRWYKAFNAVWQLSQMLTSEHLLQLLGSAWSWRSRSLIAAISHLDRINFQI